MGDDRRRTISTPGRTEGRLVGTCPGSVPTHRAFPRRVRLGLRDRVSVLQGRSPLTDFGSVPTPPRSDRNCRGPPDAPSWIPLAGPRASVHNPPCHGPPRGRLALPSGTLVGRRKGATRDPKLEITPREPSGSALPLPEA